MTGAKVVEYSIVKPWRAAPANCEAQNSGAMPAFSAPIDIGRTPTLRHGDVLRATNPNSAVSSAPLTTKREIAFIDPGVDDLSALLSGVRPDVDAIVLSDDEPVARQIGQALVNVRDLVAVHIIAHGRP